MGKRKRRTDLNKTSSPNDQLPPPGMDALSKQSLSSIMDIIDDSSEVTQCQQSSIVHRRNIDQAMCSKHPLHYYGLHYTRRRSANNVEASTSCGETTPFDDGKMSVKPASKCNLDSGHDTENKQSELHKPEAVGAAPSLLATNATSSKQSELHKPETVGAAPSLLATNATSSNVKKLLCRLCRKPLRKKRYILDSSLSSSEPSVVAVLVCGHLYHADCLEERTHHEDVTDPPCPICCAIN